MKPNDEIKNQAMSAAAGVKSLAQLPAHLTAEQAGFTLVELSIVPIVIIFLITLVLTTYLAFSIFRDYPFCQDEYAYLYQAKIFSLGRTYLPIDEPLKPLVERHMVLRDGRLLAQYPPGFPALLTIGVKLGWPGLVNPFLSAISIAVLFSAISLFTSPASALFTTFLLATNSYFLGYGASYFSQPLSLCLTAFVFYFFCKFTLKDKSRYILLTGICIFLATLTRPLDAFCLFLAIGTGLIVQYRQKSFHSNIFIVSLFALLGIVGLYIYNYWASGCFCIAPYNVWQGDFQIEAPQAKSALQYLFTIAAHYRAAFITILWPNFTDHFVHLIGPAFLLLAVWGAFISKSRIRIVGIAFIGFIVLLYNFSHYNGWPQYGARYWYPILVPLAIFVAHSVEHIRRRLTAPMLFLLSLIVVGLQIYGLKKDMNQYDTRFSKVEAIETDIELTCPVQSIVILDGAFVHSLDFVSLKDFKRNPFMNARRFFVLNQNDANAIAPYYPQYTFCHYK